MRSVWKQVLTVAIVSGLLLAWGCGGRNDEVVYLDVFNGYPGSGALSVFGPTGAVTNGLPFGQRTSNFTTINRNVGTSFQIQIEGATSTAETDLPLYSMYPHESATLFIKRRSGQGRVDTAFMRHVRTGYKKEDRQCAMVFDNALSTGNPDIATYKYLPVFKVNPACAGYLPKLGSYREDGKDIDGPDYLFRPNLVSTDRDGDGTAEPGIVERFPWFVATQSSEGDIIDVRNVAEGGCPAYSSKVGVDDGESSGGEGGGSGSNSPVRGQVIAGNSTVEFVWAPFRSILTLERARELQRAGGNVPSVDLESGSVVSAAPTREYLNCIGWNPNKSAADNVEKLQELKRQKIEKCKSGQFTSSPVTLGQQLTQYEMPAGLGKGVAGDTCGFQVRIASDFFTIFRRPSNDEPGGEPISQTYTFPPSQFSFWVLYGRPIDPFVESWGVADKQSGGGFVRLPKYPGSPPSSASAKGTQSGDSEGSGSNSGSNQ
jgi:hypothetical protein